MIKSEFLLSLRESLTNNHVISTVETIVGSDPAIVIEGNYDLGDVETTVAFFEENYDDEMVRSDENHGTKILSFSIALRLS
jgi:hypothetical protein